MGITLRSVTFSYNKKSPVPTLNNINLSIDSQNEFICIMGATGSGKSTLAQMFNALLIPNKGEITLLDYTVKPKRNKKLKPIRKKIGLVFQFPEYQLFEENVLKDIMFGPLNFGMKPKEAKEKAMGIAEKLHIEGLLERSPFNLSGGQKRRVAIAGILVSEPDILILDEPTVGLDPLGKKELLALLHDYQTQTGKTVIIITHDMNVVAQYATRCIVLRKGEISFDGTPSVLFNDLDVLEENQLALPSISRIALHLKKQGLINFNKIPLHMEELEMIIKGAKHE
ncbi:MAG: energy-coupling factor transporter ATPase [Bacilli bacterium]|nr:energy-coupling factor transporter ATPase [Bacilli bacterium]